MRVGVATAPSLPAEAVAKAVPARSGARFAAWQRWLSPIVIAVLAAVPRLVNLQYMEFKGDEARVAAAARFMVEHGSLVQAGIVSSLGSHNPPIFDYLMVVPFLFTTNAVAGAAYIALLNVAGVLITYALALRLWGRRAAIIAGVLFALQPWAVTYARKIWEQNVEAPFAALTLYALIRAREGSRWWAATAIAGWLWMAQLHPSAVLLAPVFLVAGPAFWKSLRPLPVALGLAVGLLPLVPFAAYDAAQQWHDVQTLVGALQQPAVFNGEAYGAALVAIAGMHWPILEGVTFDQFVSPSAVVLFSLLSVLYLLVLYAAAAFALLVVLDRVAPERRLAGMQRGHLLLMVGWLVVPVVLGTHHSFPIYPHYELFLIPASVLLPAFAIAWLRGWIVPDATEPIGGATKSGTPSASPRIPAAHRVVGGVLLTLCALAVAGWSVLLWSFLAWLPPKQLVGDYGPAYATTASVAGLVHGTDGILWTSAGQPFGEPFIYFFRNGPDFRPMPAQTLIVPATGQAAHYLLTQDASPLAIAALQQAGVPLQGSGSYVLDGSHTVSAFYWSADQVVSSLTSTLRPLSIQLENGVLLDAVGEQQPDAHTLRMEYVWTVGRTGVGVSDADLVLYTHVVDSAAKNVAQVDSMPVPSSQWYAGETIVSWFDVPLHGVAAGQYEVRAGMYARPSIKRVARVADNGSLVDGEFSLGMVTVTQ